MTLDEAKTALLSVGLRVVILDVFLFTGIKNPSIYVAGTSDRSGKLSPKRNAFKIRCLRLPTYYPALLETEFA